MKKALFISSVILLLGAGIAIVAAFLARSALLTLIKTDVFHGVDTFCVDLPRSTDLLTENVVQTTTNAKLKALAVAGLLDKNYKLTDHGWEQVDFDDEGCLVAGGYALAVEGVSFKRFRLLQSPAPNAQWGVIDVSIRATTNIDKLALWARSPSVHSEIPEIASALQGVRMQIAVVREKGRWGALFAGTGANQFRVPQTAEMILEPDEKKLLAKYPPPDRAALTQLWLKENANWTGRKACVQIAGSGFPVDEVVTYPIDPRLKSDGFAVAIYEMLERNPAEQKVLKLTLPRMELLERAGVLSSSVTRGPKYRSQLPGRLYVLAPGYEKYFQTRFGGGCLYAGTSETQVTASKYRGTAGKMIVRDRYTELAPWATPEVLDGMPDLRKAVTEGVVCVNRLRLDASGWGLDNGACR